MKHKKHLRKQNSGRSPEDGNGSEEKDLSDGEDIQGDGEEDPDEEMDAISDDKYENNDANCEENVISAPKTEGPQTTAIESNY